MVQLLHLALHDALLRRSRGGRTPPRWLEACINVPWISILSSITACTAWIIWVHNAEQARKHTHAVVEGFGLSLVREPCPLGASLPASLALAAALAALLAAVWGRVRVQQRVISGGLPFPDSSATHRYFALSAFATTAAWAVMAWLGCLLVATGVWMAAMTSMHSAAGAVQPPFGLALSALTDVSKAARAAAAAVESTQELYGQAAGVASAMTGGAHRSHDGGHQGGSGASWGPDWPGPGGRCPPGCVDLSAFKQYLGSNTCCCDTIGGIFAAEPNAAAASCSLKHALAALAVLVASLSWLVIQGGCQFSHSQSEGLTITDATAAAAARAGQPASLPAVRRLANWFVVVKGESGDDGLVDGVVIGRGDGLAQGQVEPLLGGGTTVA